MNSNIFLTSIFTVVVASFFFVFHKIKSIESININMLDMVIFMIIEALYMIMAILTDNKMLFYVSLLFAFYYMILWGGYTK